MPNLNLISEILEGGTTVAVRDLIVKTKEWQKDQTSQIITYLFYLLTFATYTIQLYFMYKILTEKIRKKERSDEEAHKEGIEFWTF